MRFLSGFAIEKYIYIFIDKTIDNHVLIAYISIRMRD